MKLQYIIPALSLVTFAAAGDYKASCDVLDLSNNQYLNAQCGGPNGKLRTILDLNKCIGVNPDGTMLPLADGKYAKRCQLCGLSDSSVMTCNCLDGGDKTQVVSIDLNDLVSNVDGYLHCDLSGEDGECIKQWSDDIECP
ncbi:CVNH domain-containing protein [Aspergillus melleus]|uniref:CVNH domain-containing protein n=1 Tax=Aspergillus melleus TaxID=138277 RepID=UPI001E8EDA2E|nr:uncharacterized protein LDX57_012522 [Aspergillus melleus]KAH8434892.1 hypothetical protein LDX57_012522 [Aspergillus melleus]